MSRVLRAQREIASADEATLRETIFAFTGAWPAPDAPRGALEVSASNAILSAEDAAGHLGVPRDTRPAPLTLKEQLARAAETGREWALRDVVAAAAQGDPNPPRPAPAPLAPTARGFAAVTVVAADAPAAIGRPKLQATSERARVFADAQRLAGPGACAVAVGTLVALHGEAARGHIRKLIAARYLAPCAQPSTSESEQ